MCFLGTCVALLGVNLSGDGALALPLESEALVSYNAFDHLTGAPPCPPFKIVWPLRNPSVSELGFWAMLELAGCPGLPSNSAFQG